MDDTTYKFRGDIEQFSKVLDLRISEAVRRIVIMLFNTFTLDNPVDTGYSRSNWRLGIEQPNTEVTDPPTSQQRTANKNSKGWYAAAPEADPTLISQIKGDAPVYITNSVDYVRFLEDGTSKQAPSGFVRIAIAQIAARMDEVIINAQYASV